MATFNEVYSSQALGTKHGLYRQVLAFDPGETTGTCYLATDNAQCTVIAGRRQLGTGRLDASAYDAMSSMIEKYTPTIIVIEEYRVFSWKRDQHIWAALHTPKLIGMLIGIAIVHRIPFVMQTPQEAKGFCTDERLRDWGFYTPGARHSNDAVRHAVYYTLFGRNAKVQNLEVPHDNSTG